ncbi:adenylate kinase, partial [Ostertagia ostertagi]
MDRKKIDLAPLKKANVPIFFIVGGPGSGKGTQCEKIVAKYGLSHLSSGDLLRDEVKSGSPRGAKLDKIMKAGELVPLEVVLDLVKEAMLKEVAKGSKGFLIDGYPRDVKQGEQFEREIQDAKSVIYFDVAEDILSYIISYSGRADDNMETIKKRLKTFTTATAPVVSYYEKKKKLIRIKADGTVDEIFTVVCQHLDKHVATKKSETLSIQRKSIDLAPLKKANVPIFFIVKSGSPRGAQLNKIMEAGEKLSLDLIKEAMLKEVAKGSKGFLIDGYPREVKQGEQFENEIQEAKSVIFFDVPEDVLVKRLLHRAKTSGRADDNMDTIKKRLKTFTTATAPVVDYYEKKKKLIRIDAQGTIDEIFAVVQQHLDKLIPSEKSTVERKQIDLTPLKKAKVPIFFIVGGPGSGKGTQCEKIVAKYKLSHLSSGDLLRDEVIS